MKFKLIVAGILCCGGVMVAIACITRTITAEPVCAVCGKWNGTVAVAYGGGSPREWHGGMSGALPPAELPKYMVHFCEHCTPLDRVPLDVATDSAPNSKHVVFAISLIIGLIMGCVAWIMFGCATGSPSFALYLGQNSNKLEGRVILAILFLALTIMGWRIGILWQFILLSGIMTMGEVFACVIAWKRKVVIKSSDEPKQTS